MTNSDRPPLTRRTRTVLETCQILGLNKKTVHKLIHAGELHGRQVGNKFIVSVASIKRYLGEDDDSGSAS